VLHWGMQDRTSKPPRLSRDTNQRAFQVVALLTGTAPPETPKPEKDPAAVSLGRRGGLKGGKARAAKLSPEQRKEIAKKAAGARWHPSST
jgi:hypothetical protein